LGREEFAGKGFSSKMSFPLGTSSQVAYQIFLAFLIDVGIQLVFFAISAALKTEKYYDVSASLTYTSIIISLAMVSNSYSQLNARQILLSIFVLIWTIRLGFFLFKRVLSVKDSVRKKAYF
jgi:steroid 5-alpha reductase family enzyme